MNHERSGADQKPYIYGCMANVFNWDKLNDISGTFEFSCLFDMIRCSNHLSFKLYTDPCHNLARLDTKNVIFASCEDFF